VDKIGGGGKILKNIKPEVVKFRVKKQRRQNS